MSGNRLAILRALLFGLFVGWIDAVAHWTCSYGVGVRNDEVQV